jgi:hypothetical protein
MSLSLSLLLATMLASAPPLPSDYFTITVVDQSTGRGVPLVELRTIHGLVHITDSNGVAAFYEPGLMDQEVFFTVSSHGYEFPADGFGFRGKRLRTSPGQEAVLKIKRLNIAERLYRITGAGIYADSIKIGKPSPIQHPLLNAQVLGSDSVQDVVFRDRIHWFWGDTNRPSYPLGNFHVPGATSRLTRDGGLDPSRGIDLEYFVGEDGFAKSTCKMPGQGPTWIDGLVVLKDAHSRERLLGHYVKVQPPLTIYEHGLAEFIPDRSEFEPLCVFPRSAPFYPSGHAFLWRDNGTDYVCFAKPFPLVRVPASVEALQDLKQYETFTCLTGASQAGKPIVDRAASGEVQYGWSRLAPPLTQELHDALVRDGQLKPGEARWSVRDIETSKPIRVHHGSMYFNAYRQRWILIASEVFGSSMLGEVWLAEADTPTGPWTYARKIVTHDRQSFYNPKQHPQFDQDEGRTLFFEGTYTQTFSGNNERTSRYDYNQIMYRLDLADPRMVLPVPVYRDVSAGCEILSLGRPRAASRYDEVVRSNASPLGRPPAASHGENYSQVAFFACDRPFPGSVAVRVADSPQGSVLRVAPPDAPDLDPPRFFALPSNLPDPPAAAVPLYEYRDERGVLRYRAGQQPIDLLWGAATRLCLVWAVPSVN